jgi:hypothetical protein
MGRREKRRDGWYNFAVAALQQSKPSPGGFVRPAL